MNVFKKLNYEYFSFDIFDTLLYRKISPNEIHNLVEKKLIKIDKKFLNHALKRLVAEKKAQKSEKIEATIYEIYDYISDYSKDEKQIAIKLEIETEIENLYPNLKLKQKINNLKKDGKKIIIISDMYYTKEILEKILKFFNFEFDYLFVSSDIQLRKHNGKIFKYIIKKLAIPKNKMIHIGDNKISDYIMPKLNGIKGILWKNKQDKHLKKLINFKGDYKKLYQFISDKKVDTYFEYIGYAYFGPLLFGFCNWIHSKIELEKLDSICFLSRDGQIVKKAYSLIYDEDYPYFLASRRSLTVPLLENAKEMKDILSIVPYIKKYEEVSDFLKKIGIENKEIENILINKYGKTINRNLLCSDEGNDIFNIVKSEMYKNAANEQMQARKYIEKNMKKGLIGLVDIGWYGTMQKSLIDLCNLFDLKIDFYGLYLGLLKKDNYDSNKADGYVYSYNKNKKYDANLIYGFNGLIELMFTADHGSAKKYYSKNENVMCELEPEKGEYSTFVQQVQSGALQFIEEYKKSKLNFNINWIKCYVCMEDLLTNPTISECYLLGDLKFYDAYFEKIIQYNGLLDFVKHPRKNIKLFLKSNWKIGYLKEMFVFLNSKEIYKIINKLK